MRASLFLALALGACVPGHGTLGGSDSTTDTASDTADTGSTTDTGGTDTGATDTGTADTGTADTGTTGTGMVDATFIVRDLRFLTDVGGADAVVGEASGTTSGSGETTLAIPADAGFEGSFLQSDYLDLVAYGYTGGQDFSMEVWTVKRAELNSIANDISVHLNNGDGLVVVPVLGPTGDGGLDWLGGATVDLDVDYGTAAVPDPNTLVGYAVDANTTRADVPTFVLFFNVPPGAVNVSVTGPEGTQCTVEPGAQAAQSIEAFAGTVSVQAFVCE